MDQLTQAEVATEAARSFGPHIGGDSGEWALFGELVRNDPRAAWARLLRIVAITDEDGLYWVADVLEGLVQADHSTFVPLIEAEVVNNRRLGDALIDFVPTAPEAAVNDSLVEIRDRVERSRMAEGPTG